VCDGATGFFAIGEDGELFSWGEGESGLLGHGDTQDQHSPKRIEALRGVRVRSVAHGEYHAIALAEDGLVYAWGERTASAVLGNQDFERELLPKPIEALRGVRVGIVAAGGFRSYAVTELSELLAWGINQEDAPLGHGVQGDHSVPTPIALLQGVKVDAVAAAATHTLALANDGSVYAWGGEEPAQMGALGLGPAVSDAGQKVSTPRRVPGLRVACELG
jgi:alpha-tubulin suppressor-like RCC1 family protein